MLQDVNSAAVHLCPLCGAPLLKDECCEFDQPEDRSPALGDYAAMNKGLMTHAEHLLVVARWFMHNPKANSPAVLDRMRPVVREAWGKRQRLFPLDA